MKFLKRLILCKLAGFHDFQCRYWPPSKPSPKYWRVWGCRRRCGFVESEEISEEIFAAAKAMGKPGTDRMPYEAQVGESE